MDVRQFVGVGRHVGGCRFVPCRRDLGHAGFQRVGHDRLLGVDVVHRVGGFCRLGLFGLRLEHDVRHLRFGIAVAHAGDLRGERIGVRQLRLDRVELAHHVVDHVDRLAQQAQALGGQRQVGGAQTLEQAFKRRQQLRQQRDVDHRDRPMQRVHGAQQFLADRQLVVAALDRGANGLQVLRHFTAQDLQQHRIHRRHHRHRHGLHGLGRLRRDGCGTRVGQACRGYGLGRRVDPRHAPAHHAAHRLHRPRCVVLHPRGVARRELFGGMHDRAERCTRCALALERGQQLRQRIDRMPHQRLRVVVRLDGVVQHAIEHVLHFPRELAQHAGTDQPARALQRVERTADADQRRNLRGIGQPEFLGAAQVVDFLLHLLQENLADVVVDALGIDVEAGVRRQRVAHRHLLDHLLLDLDPVLARRVGRGVIQGGRRGGFGLRQAQPVQVVGGCGGGMAVADEELPQVLARQQADGLGQFGVLLARSGGFDRRCLGCRRRGRRRACRRQWPVAEQAEAVLGHVEYVFQSAAMLARRLQVVLQRRQRIGQLVHLCAARYAPVIQQFVADETAHALGQLGRARRRQHVHGAGNFFHQRRCAGQAIMLPAGFDERDDRVLDPAGVGDRLLHQRGDHAQRFAARQAGHGVVRARFFLGTETFDVVVQRRLDVQQRAGHVEQGLLVGRAHAVGDLVEHPALFGDYPARHRQRQHAQRVADALEHFALRGQLRRIAVLLAQEQVQRLLDAQQVVLQRARHRIEQCAVVPGHRAAGVFQFAGIGQQAVQRVRAAQQLHLRAALLGLGHDVEQLAGHVVRFAAAQAVLALLDQQADVAVDLADQLADFAGLSLQRALLQAFQHAGGDPPQAPAMHVMAARGDRQQGLAHVDQLLRGVLPAEPAQQLLLEAQAQVHQFAAMRLGVGFAHRRGRLLRQERIEVRVEHRRFGQRLLLAAGTQVVEQRQQHHRHVAVAAGQPFQVVGQLHQAAHQRGVGFLAIGDVIPQQGDGERLHLCRHHRRAVQLDHPQGALHLVQVIRAGAHVVALARVVDVRLQRLAGDRQGVVELRLDPLQRGEIDVVLKSHAPLSTVAQRKHPATTETAPCLVLCSIGPATGPADVNPAA